MSFLVAKQAPDFTAQAVFPDDSISEMTLSQYRGKYVLLFSTRLILHLFAPVKSLLSTRKLLILRRVVCSLSVSR